MNHGISSKNARAGQSIIGRVMQDVPLSNGSKIPEGAKVLGAILSVSTPGGNNGAKISLRFNEIQIHQQGLAIVTALRAIASPMELQFAHIPETPGGFGTPYTWVTTKLIGGGVKYGVGGPVTDKSGNTVGEGTYDGVLDHVKPQPEGSCRGALDLEDRLQALWVFSADACGVYGTTGVTLEHAGRSDPAGEITLAVQSGDLKIRGGTGMLLRVLR